MIFRLFQLANVDYILIYGIIGFLVATWCFGHLGVWGKLSTRYIDMSRDVHKQLCANGFNIGFSKDGQWEGGFYSLLFFNDKGIYFKPPIFIRFFFPSIFIPWDQIRRIKKCNKNLLWELCDEIEINDFEYTVVIPERVGDVLRNMWGNMTLGHL